MAGGGHWRRYYSAPLIGSSLASGATMTNTSICGLSSSVTLRGQSFLGDLRLGGDEAEKYAKRSDNFFPGSAVTIHSSQEAKEDCNQYRN